MASLNIKTPCGDLNLVFVLINSVVYQMAPRSWRPNSSLADNVPTELIQIELVEDPLAVPMEIDAIDMVMNANEFLARRERSNLETQTPRYCYRYF